jgi:hypothetical protein
MFFQLMPKHQRQYFYLVRFIWKLTLIFIHELSEPDVFSDLFEILFSGYIVAYAVSSQIIAHVINGKRGLPLSASASLYCYES